MAPPSLFGNVRTTFGTAAHLRLCFLLLALITLGSPLRIGRGAHDGGADALTELLPWMRANGAIVKSGLRASTTFHGGAAIRGVITTAQLPVDESLMMIPRKLWFTLDKFVEVQAANLSAFGKTCDGLQGDSLDQLKIAAALALEEKKGTASFWYPFLRALPSLKDFRTFYPQFAEPIVLAEFRELPVIATAKAWQTQDDRARGCFQSWRRSEISGHTVLGQGMRMLEWTDMQLALAQFRTRRYQVDYNNAMMPGSDMFNTAPSKSINSAWSADAEGFTIRTYASVPSDSEILDPYCTDCDNDRMMVGWGVYLERNMNALARAGSVNCNAVVAHGDGSAFRSLRQATQAMLRLDGDGLAQLATDGLSAPRCVAHNTRSADQGPLRCGLARLAWEFCAQSWRRHDVLQASANSTH